jgi:hypothetical protein
MKVLDLACANQHLFEGWFASEDDFVAQCARRLVECPVCGDAQVSKKLSAPRLNLGAGLPEVQPARDLALAKTPEQGMQLAWLEMARRVVSNTDDVGDKFAEEARRIHYGEAKERGIRGKATAAQTEALIDEGIAVMPMLLPESLKGQLQ